MNTWAAWQCTCVNPCFSSRLFLLTHHMTGSYLFGVAHTAKGHLKMGKRLRKNLNKCHLQSEGGNNKSDSFWEQWAFWAKVYIYLEVWCSWSSLQHFVCGGFWPAEVWENKLEGKINQVVFLSCIHAAKWKFKQKLQKLSGRSVCLQITLCLALMIFCKLSVAYD